MRGIFNGDVRGVEGLRALVFIGWNEAVWGRWSSEMLRSGEGAVSLVVFCEEVK